VAGPGVIHLAVRLSTAPGRNGVPGFERVTLAGMDIPTSGLHLRPSLLQAGVTDGELQRLRRTRTVTRLRRGAYVPSDDERLRRPESRHVLLVRATVPGLTAGSVVSHASAAALHGLPVWAVGLERVHVTRRGSGGGRVSRGLHLHVAPLDPFEVVEVDGILVTSVARTILDMARSVPFTQAVVVADGALFTGRVVHDDLRAAQERAARWRGGPRALRVVDFSSELAESPGESRSRVAMGRAELPRPVLQWKVYAADGRFLGRVDFGWPELGTVGEFDGLVKYGRLVPEGSAPADVVVAEKLREDALRAEGLMVVRWMSQDIDRFDRIAARLRRAFALR
jgi:hypothetical protein